MISLSSITHTHVITHAYMHNTHNITHTHTHRLIKYKVTVQGYFTIIKHHVPIMLLYVRYDVNVRWALHYTCSFCHINYVFLVCCILHLHWVMLDIFVPHWNLLFHSWLHSLGMFGQWISFPLCLMTGFITLVMVADWRGGNTVMLQGSMNVWCNVSPVISAIYYGP